MIRKVKILLLLIQLCVFGQMTSTQVGVDLIKNFEGFRSKAYLCPAQVWTIGYGSTRGVNEGMVITKYEAELLLIEDMRRFERHVNDRVYRLISWYEFDALVSFSFNLGYRIKGRLQRFINEGNTQSAMYVLKLYNKARIGGVLTVLPGLVKRRNAEAFLYTTGCESQLRERYLTNLR